MSDVCQQCDNQYKGIAAHWVQSSDCSHPTLTKRQREISVGLLMGDGTVNSHHKNPYLSVQMISPNYLEYLDDVFGVLSRGVIQTHTAETSAEMAKNSGFSPNAKPENYSDVYQWGSISHPELHEFSEWYSSGKKVWPDTIELTPTVLKHWYCGDGHRDNRGDKNYIQIAMLNERKHTDKVDKLFKNANLPSPNNYSTGERCCNAQFTVDQSQELFEYMGKPLPDFEYKWPEVYRN